MKRKYRILPLLFAGMMMFSACDLEVTEDGSPVKSGDSRSSITRTVEDGALKIDRLSRSNPSAMGVDGTWTIFLYMCGTDLETEYGMASMDMQEMVDSYAGENVRFVIQTGGTDEWDNDFVDSTTIQRYVVSNGEITLVDEQDDASMGDSETLESFLSWGVGEYPAENMGLVFWNHGGGSISGVCFDENNDFDSLSLREIDAALLNTYDTMQDNFTFIGFDACLMGTIECANILATYADYMVGSEETEPGYGWDYTAIGNFLADNPDADGAALGTEICDSFYESCALVDSEDGATLSVIDLSKIDELIVSFNSYAEALYQASEDKSVLAEFARGVKTIDNYGGNNKSEGYTNMVDLAGMIHASESYVSGADAVVSAIDNAVVYTKNGKDHAEACGLSTYYPLEIQGSEELGIFGDVAVNPYYLALVDRVAYGASGSDVSDYDETSIFDIFDDFSYEESDGEFWYDEETDDYWENYSDTEPTGESPYVEFYDEPQLDEEGSHFFSLTDESMYEVSSVQASVYTISEDGEDLIELGISVDILADWENGIFCDNFDGYWFCLPDGQNLAVYVVEECDGYDIYTSPVEVNGEETNLRITHDYVNGTVTIDGTWDGIDENGMAGRDVTALAEGDIITPLYYAMAIDSDDEYYYYGDDYAFDGTPEIYFDTLSDGEYLYGFYIDDIYGDYYTTDYVNFTVDGENIYFE